MKKIIILLLVSLLSANGAFANDREEIEMINKSAITLAEAIQIAEKEIGGKAYSASIDDDAFTPQFEIDVVAKGGTAYNVKVDGTTKKVLGSRVDRD